MTLCHWRRQQADNRTTQAPHTRQLRRQTPPLAQRSDGQRCDSKLSKWRAPCFIIDTTRPFADRGFPLSSEALQVKIAEEWTSLGWEERVPRAVRRRIVEMAEAGFSQRAIADRLNADGVPAVGGRWHRGTVIRVLRQAAA